MRYPRYPRVPRYGIPRVFTGVTPVNTQRDALPTAQQLVPTQHKCSVLLGAALLSLLTSTTIGCGVEVGVGVGSAAEFNGCVPGNGLPDEVDAAGGAFPEVTFPFPLPLALMIEG